jgi:hypothetical protein
MVVARATVRVMHHVVVGCATMVVAHMVVMRMARMVLGRGEGRGREQRGCQGDNGQGCEKATHWRLQDEDFSAAIYHPRFRNLH